jgi:hypothetical protein
VNTINATFFVYQYTKWVELKYLNSLLFLSNIIISGDQKFVKINSRFYNNVFEELPVFLKINLLIRASTMISLTIPPRAAEKICG